MPIRLLLAAARAAASLRDGFARRISYLRVSLTDRCNYRCTYCMPEEGVPLRPRPDVLTFEELERLVRVFAGLGVSRVRLTGGEPTVRKGVVEIVGRIAAVPGVREVVMTTNGHLLAELASPLAAAGLVGVNVSLDSLDPDRFRALTRRGDLARVVAGVDAARAAGLGTKLNAVVLRGENDGELAALCAFAWRRGATPRFIEHMPMSDGAVYRAGGHVAAAEIRARVEAAFGASLAAVGADAGAGPARYFRLPDGRTLGVIAALTEHFCDACNRLRLTATGELHACLGHDDATDLRAVVRGGGGDGDVRDAIVAAVAGKRAGHDFTVAGDGAPTKHMISIGG